MRLLTIASLAALVSTLGCQSGPDPEAAIASGTESMVTRLGELAQTATEARFFRNDDGDEAASDRPRTAPKNVGEQVALLIRVARKQLKNGDIAEAVESLETARSLVLGNARTFPAEVRMVVRSELAVAYLVLGERQNCIANHNADSCLLPIKDGGVHVQPEATRLAVEEYQQILVETPDHLYARWLLNIGYMALGEYPDGVPERWRIEPEAFESDYQLPRFYDVAPGLGMAVMGMSGGSVMEDLDGDGDLDIMCSSWDLEHRIRLFLSRGDGTFEDATEAAGLTGLTGGLNLIHADYDNDGDDDVFALRGAWQGNHPNSLLRNNGDGTFDDVTEEAGLLSFHPTQTASWGDYDNDGLLDLFIGNESMPDNVHRAELYHNEGNGTFREVAAATGLDAVGFIKGVSWGDYDNDGRINLYVARMFGPNFLFHNEGPDASGAWRFRDLAREAGVGEPTHSLPAWFFDYDNDGWLDIFVSGFDVRIFNDRLSDVPSDYLGLETDGERPRLYRNRGDGTFADVTRAAGLDHVLFTMGSNFGDVDTDGFPDMYLGTGAPDFRSLMPNRLFRNDAGERFQDATTSAGLGHLQKGHGVAFGDLDNDGDEDMYHVLGGAYRGDSFPNALYVNPGHGHHWLVLQLRGTRSNRSAIHARIKLVARRPDGSKRELHTSVTTGGSFGSSSLQQEIGLGQATSVESIEVTWPTSGIVQRFTEVAINQAYAIEEGTDTLRVVERQPFDLTGHGEKGHEHQH